MSLPLPARAFRAHRGAWNHLAFFLIVLTLGLFSPRAAHAQTGSISGFVVDTLGNRISGATVAATTGPSAPVQTTSAADGSYLLSRLNPGFYIFTANRSGFTGTSRSFTVNSGVSARVDFTIRSQTAQGGVVQGHVFQKGTTTPIAGARVDLTGGAGVISQSTLTDDTGLYQFSNLLTGRVRLTVTRAGFVDQTRSLNVTEGRTTTADFSLRLRASQLATLSGVVTDTNGQAIRGAVVTLSGGISAGMSDTTDSRGRYSIARIIPDAYTVTVTAAGFVASAGTNIVLDQNESEVLDFSLTSVGAATAGLAGLVVDSNGQPISGARVAITGGPVTGRSDITDATGLYEILGLPAGTYTLRASATGFTPQNRTVSIVVDTTSQLDFFLSQEVNQLLGSITGTVTRTDGTTISGVTVRVTAGPTQGQSVQTDSQGNFSVPDLPEGIYTLTFSGSGFATRTLTGIEVLAGLQTQLDVQLGVSSTSGTITGTVTDVDGAAISNVQVRVLQGSTVVATGTTGSLGTYSISGLSPGTYSIQFSRSGFTTALVTGVAVAAGDSVTVNVQLVTSGTSTGLISGIVLDSLGRPVQSATVVLDGPTGSQSTTTDADGGFQFANLAPGTTYSVTVSASGFETDTRRNITVTAGNEVTLQIQLRQSSNGGGSLSGFVRNPSNAPVVGATVTIVGGPSVGQTRTTSSSGQFSFAGLPGGTYTIEVRSVNFRPARVTVNVRPGGGAFVTITLRR